MPLLKFDRLPDTEEWLEYPPEFRERYVITGLNDLTSVNSTAMGLLALAIASPAGILYRQPLVIERIGHNVYHVAVTYSQKKFSTLEWTIRGRTTGGTQKIRGSLETIETSVGAPDFQQLIGVNADGTVEGTEVIVPILEFSIDIVYPLGHVNQSMMNAWANLTGTTNAGVWLGRQRGEVLFLGSEFEDGTTTPAAVTHNVAIQPNLTNGTIAGLAGINKRGWEFLWFQVEDAVDGGVPVKRAVHWYVEKIYQESNFAAILGFGA